ncbi:hypothetical protein BAUCODRAFT_475913 [Baudoinia panamericana UAMH 10762]|uniref:Uncharacterized protein n=1 Tax=Baudoinia panamericana (strain UAMH 10762) TaxID=717646 RepID=M2NC63_BAUPA|nr:uncharacterized protein BAUCODRAFT_475913 [Baudoinia panamericana UAMH 10762]EMC96470.1 hypothetical protein BAUCODRAFT_475913 [Baudoinia panamericana UAMH 10762]
MMKGLARDPSGRSGKAKDSKLHDMWDTQQRNPAAEVGLAANHPIIAGIDKSGNSHGLPPHAGTTLRMLRNLTLLAFRAQLSLLASLLRGKWRTIAVRISSMSTMMSGAYIGRRSMPELLAEAIRCDKLNGR